MPARKKIQKRKSRRKPRKPTADQLRAVADYLEDDVMVDERITKRWVEEEGMDIYDIRTPEWDFLMTACRAVANWIRPDAT